MCFLYFYFSRVQMETLASRWCYTKNQGVTRNLRNHHWVTLNFNSNILASLLSSCLGILLWTDVLERLTDWRKVQMPDTSSEKRL